MMRSLWISKTGMEAQLGLLGFHAGLRYPQGTHHGGAPVTGADGGSDEPADRRGKAGAKPAFSMRRVTFDRPADAEQTVAAPARRRAASRT